MRYTAYDGYTDSGIAWFETYPAHWNIRRIKWTIEYIKNGVWGSEPDGFNDIIVLRVADFDRTSLRINEDTLTLRSVEEKERQGRLLSHGDLLIEKSGGGEKQLVGAVVQFDKEFPAITSNFIAAMRVSEGFSSRFLTYLHFHLYANKVNYRSIKQTTGIQNLDSGLYFDEIVAVPEFEEQKKIACFLDYKTSQIDALIAKKKELIEKLKEQRLAVITRAITKGLDPNAPMRDSGVDWLGRIPKHWEVIPLGFLITMSGGMTPSSSNSNFWDGDIPWVTPKDMKQDRISDSIDHITDYALAETSISLIAEGAVLIVVRGMILAHSFPTAITERPVTVNQDMKALRCGELLEVEYLFWALTGFAKVFSSLAQESAHGTRKMETYTLKKFRFPVPPIPEQITIVRDLERRLERLDQLSKATIQTIDRLTEYRTALITAATTGKIDVCGVKLDGAK